MQFAVSLERVGVISLPSGEKNNSWKKNTHISDRSKDTSSVGVGDGTIFGVQWTTTEFVLLPSIGGRGVGGGAVNRVKQFFGIPEGIPTGIEHRDKMEPVTTETISRLTHY